MEPLVNEATSVAITTNHDIWDHYLSAVFLGSPRPSDGRGVRGEGSPDEVNREELFLNNLLLENGRARRYDKVALADWEQE